MSNNNNPSINNIWLQPGTRLHMLVYQPVSHSWEVWIATNSRAGDSSAWLGTYLELYPYGRCEQHYRSEVDITRIVVREGETDMTTNDEQLADKVYERSKHEELPLRRPERTHDGRIYTVYINDDEGRYRVAYTDSTYPGAIKWVINNCHNEQWTIFEERRISGSKQIKTSGV